MTLGGTAAPDSNFPVSVEEFLVQLNLGNYWEIFKQTGFDTLDTLQDLNKSILNEMKVARGHQSKLLRKAKELALHAK